MNAPRGFALVSAVLLAVATAAAAVGLVVVVGGARVGVIHTVGGETAEAIARTGLERAEAYALAAATGEQDFDRVLDPLLEADCRNVTRTSDTGVVPERGSMYLPRFTDTGATTTTWNGQRWRVVPWSGGAYLVRYEDDQDDGIVAVSSPDWSLSTSNTRSGAANDATNCLEGTGAQTGSPPGSSGVHNPARDRNRAVFATIVGIFPGGDPATALHRTVLRKLIVDNRKAGPGALRVGGDVTSQSGGVLQLCSDESGVTASGEIDTGSPGSCSCGDTTGTEVTLTGGDDGSCGECCTNENPYEASTTATAPPPNIPNASAARWYDWGSVCNFHMDAQGLYWWDARAGRGVLGTCGEYAGNFVPPSTNTNDQGSCWTPLFLVAPLSVPIASIDAARGAPHAEVASCGSDCMEWRPRRDVVTYDLGAAPGTGYFTAGTRATTGTKPDWSTCPDTSSTDLRWKPPSSDPGSGVAPVGCTTCDGSNATIRWRSAAPSWRLENASTSITAFPAGTYRHQGALVWGSTGGTAPTSTTDPLKWRMITLVVAGNLNVPNGGRMWLGVGTKKNLFPSLIVDGTLRVESGARFEAIGSIYVTDDLLVESGGSQGAYLYGTVTVGDDVTVSNGGELNWDYDVPLDAEAPPPPSPRLAFPLSF